MVSVLTRSRPRQPKPLTRERILRAARDGNLEKELEPHYSVYYEPAWVEKLQRIKDLDDEGLLRGSKFDPQLVGDQPAFLADVPRITTEGLEYLEKRQQQRWRFAWSFVLAVGAPVTVGLILYWLKKG
jgi:hypothetical protein